MRHPVRCFFCGHEGTTGFRRMLTQVEPTKQFVFVCRDLKACDARALVRSQ